MFNGFSPRAIDFLWDVGFYNERAWFLEHKQEYLELLDRPLKELAFYLEQQLALLGPERELQAHVSRIYRDQRRSHGRGPYKDHLWFTLRPPQADDEWWARPTLWFEIGKDMWSYGLGYYQARPATMERHRRRIDRHPRALQRLARELNGQSEFVLIGEDYARAKGDPGPLLRPWYNKRNLGLQHEGKPGMDTEGPELALRLLTGFTFLLPYYDYFFALEAEKEDDIR